MELHDIPSERIKLVPSLMLLQFFLGLAMHFIDGNHNLTQTKGLLFPQEARTAIEQVVIPRGEAMDLLPRPWNIMLLQKDLIRKYKLKSERIGSEPNVHLRVLPFQDANDEDEIKDEKVVADDDELEELFFKPITTEANGSPYSSLDRLPLLPDN